MGEGDSKSARESLFAQESLAAVGESVRARFESEKRVLSFAEYLELLRAHPRRYCRDAPRFLRDALDYYGTYEVARPWGEVTRYRLFDLPFESTEGRRSDRLVGQEEIQHQVYRALDAFEREGRIYRLLLLHGPNGSAKSTLASCLAAGLEHYSSTDEGALYRFSWVFPRGDSGKGIGFSTQAVERAVESYAHLPEERIDAKLPSELREHPLLLLPVAERRALLEKLGVKSPPDLLWSGDLGHKNRQVFDALLTAYRGDLDRVLAHVQVERYYISRRYRVGAVTIGPQMAVDARERQLTADRSLGALPASLSATTLFESFGELVDAAGGIIEYSDLLKRPLDAWKYLLIAIESGEVALPFSNMQLNTVLLASSNEMHLKAFQEHPEYHSFRGRLLPIRVPYLRDYLQEEGIYNAQIAPQLRVPVAPHAMYVAALWAVLTRLRRAQRDRYDTPSLGMLAASLTPVEKAELYAQGKVPRRFDADEAKLLEQGAGEVYLERTATLDYEGLIGASPREMRGILHSAADAEGLTPLAILAELERFCERDDYVFLRVDADGHYHDVRRAIQTVRERWLDRVDEELRGATGLIDEAQYQSLFDRYVTHVSHAMKDERIQNPLTGDYEEPDKGLMEHVESMLGAEEAKPFRQEMLSHVATWALDHPGEEVDYTVLFPQHMERLAEAYFLEQKERIAKVAGDVLRITSESDEALEEEEGARAAHRVLIETHGYDAMSLQQALTTLLESRYK